MTKKVVLVTGANKGLGFETCRQLARQGKYEVILTSRDPKKGKKAAEKLLYEGMKVTYYPLDISDAQSVEAVLDQVKKEWGQLDILINNAAIGLDFEEKSASFEETQKRFLETLNTNVVGSYMMCEAFFPLMEKQGYGRIVNVSSGAGQLDDMEDNYPTYRISKLALNGVTRIFASKCGDKDILVNSVCPGWVKTDMGGEEALLEVEEGVQTILWAATLEKGAPNGSFFREKKAIPW